MKRIIPLFACLFVFILICTSCANKSVKQIVSAWLIEDDKEIYATVDVSDGWSAEFASGAIYIYDEEIAKGTESVGMCITLSEETYNDYLKEAERSQSVKQHDNALYYETLETANYLFERDGMYMLLTVNDKDKAEDVFSRLAFSKDSVS